MKPENVECPECSGLMISRSGKFGVFWGCTNYPDCRGTRDSEGRSKADREQKKREKDPYYDGSDIVDQENLERGMKASFNRKRN